MAALAAWRQSSAYRSPLSSAPGKAAVVLLKAYQSARKVTAPTAPDDFSFIQYRHADAEHADAALQTFAGFWEELRKLSPDKGHELNLAKTSSRLAFLEEAQTTLTSYINPR
jgi:hypothetical protein